MTSSETNATAARRLLPRWLSALIALAFMAGALVVIRNELRHNDLHQIIAAFRAIAPETLAAAAGLVLVSYACLTGCERIALAILGRRDIPLTRIIRATFASYALGNAVGFSYATVPAARIRLYKNDLTAAQIAALSAITGGAVMIAGAAIAGIGLLAAGAEFAARFFGEPWMWRLAGLTLIAPACVWLAVAAGARLGGWLNRLKLQAPSSRAAVAQVAMGMADWAAAAAVLYILLPGHGGWSYPAFLAVFLAAGVLGAASGAPAGIGVFEASILALSPDTQHAPTMAAALIVYRLIWTMAPLALAALLLAHDVARQNRQPALKTP